MVVVLVTGATGQLGESINYIAPNYPNIEFVFAPLEELDITNPENVSHFFNNKKFDYCINTAAYTAVDKAESDDKVAYLVNVVGVKNLAKACEKTGTTLLHISTDFIFDGNINRPYTETDIANPLGIYGKTKLEGENEVILKCKKYYIVRTSWVYSQFGNNFMKTMLKLGREREELNIVSDQIGTPTYAVDLANTLLSIIENDKINNYGIYNFSNEGFCSWYDFAVEIFKQNKIPIKVNPIPTESYPTPAKRPKYSVLDKSKIKTIFGIKIKDWKESLAQIN